MMFPRHCDRDNVCILEPDALIGTTAAIIIAAGVAGGAAASAKIQSNAAKGARNDQQTATDKALAVQREQYNALQEQFKPYAQAGSGAMTRLSDMVGQRPVTQAVLPPGVQRPPTIAPSLPKPATPSAQTPMSETQARTMEDVQSPTTQTFAPSAGGNVVPIRAMQPARAAAQQMVMMRSPDGKETRSVPAARVAYFKSKGATVVEAA